MPRSPRPEPAPPDTTGGSGPDVADPRRGRLRRWWTRPEVRRFSLYSVGSVAAFAVSQFVFLATYGPGLTSPQMASVAAFAVGAPVNWWISRRFAWQRRERPGLRTELVPYAGVIGASIAASAVGTWAVDRVLASAGLTRAVEVAIVGATFALINVGLFLGKYVVLNRLVFRDPSPKPDRVGSSGP